MPNSAAMSSIVSPDDGSHDSQRSTSVYSALLPISWAPLPISLALHPGLPRRSLFSAVCYAAGGWEGCHWSAGSALSVQRPSTSSAWMT